MSAREALIFDVNEGKTVSEAARDHGVARSCAAKWVARYRAHGREGLQERSRRPESSPNRISQKTIDELIALKNRYPELGPAKLVAILENRHARHVMAVSTAGEILLRRGLVKRRRVSHTPGRIEHPGFEVAGAGDVMTGDFKGEFRLGDGSLCFPLTAADPGSRTLLEVRALLSTHTAPAKKSFERIFREHGVPRLMVTDGGSPFSSALSLGGLTQLSRWWIEMGITPVRIQPGRPQQNGIHERMHRTLQEWVNLRPQMSLEAQQRSFNEFRRWFNNVRPHEALDQKPPATAYRPYRPWSERPRSIEYDTNMDVRLVNANGELKWKGHPIFASEVLVGAKVGLLRIADDLLAIYFGAVRLGYLDEIEKRVRNRKPEQN